MKGNINVYVDISLETLNILSFLYTHCTGFIFTGYYCYTWICQVYANAIYVFLVRPIYKPLLFFCTPADSISNTNTLH